MSLEAVLLRELGAIRRFEERSHSQSKTVIVEGEKRSGVLRISKHPAVIETNFSALQGAFPLGVSPEPLAFFQEGGLFYSLESFIEGRMAQKEDAPLIKEALLKLYQVKRESPVSWKEAFFQREETFLKRSPWFSLIEENFPDVECVQLIHGDMSLSNMILREGKVLFIDFQKAFFGELEYDVARLLWYEGIALEGPWNPQKVLFYTFVLAARWRLIYPEEGREAELLELKSRLFP